METQTMWKKSTPTVLIAIAVCATAFPMIVHATKPPTSEAETTVGNTYYLYTSRYDASDSGVVKLPSNLTWSVETSWRGPNLPDSRVLIRLHDDRRQFSALTAQMDLATAAKLHHELGEIIVKKLQYPNYQDRAHLRPHKEGVTPTAHESYPLPPESVAVAELLPDLLAILKNAERTDPNAIPISSAGVKICGAKVGNSKGKRG